MEILFKGEYIDNNTFEYGYLVVEPDGRHVIYNKDSFESFEVKPETAAIFTGVESIYKEKLFHRDYVKAYRRDDNMKKTPVYDQVTWLNGCFMLFNCTFHEFFRLWQSNWEIVTQKEYDDYIQKRNMQ